MEQDVGTHNDSREYGPSWGDVLVALEELRMATGRGVMIQISQTASTTRPSRLYVRVVAVERRNDSKTPGERGSGYPWPHSDFRTMPAMILHLCHVLDRCFEEERRAAEGQSAF